jgi:hypothetical protein
MMARTWEIIHPFWLHSYPSGATNVFLVSLFSGNLILASNHATLSHEPINHDQKL